MEELLASLTAQEWLEWQVYNSIEPIGGARTDVQTAMLAHMIASTVPRKKGRKLPPLKDFVPKWWADRAPEQQPRVMLGFVAGLTKAMGGTIAPTVEEAMRGEQSREAGGDPRA